MAFVILIMKTALVRTSVELLTLPQIDNLVIFSPLAEVALFYFSLDGLGLLPRFSSCRFFFMEVLWWELTHLWKCDKKENLQYTVLDTGHTMLSKTEGQIAHS